jgi:hypothetical protein
VALVTALLAYPLAVAMAFTVVVAVTLNEPP